MFIVKCIVSFILATLLTGLWLEGSKRLGDWMICNSVIADSYESWMVYFMSSIVLIMMGLVWASLYSMINSSKVWDHSKG